MTSNQFHYFVSLFRSRSDVYARYWQKGPASGYSPAYRFDWVEFNRHRARGGRLQDFKNKQTLPLTLGVFLEHIRGGAAVGIYPILPDNTCCFLAADFDGTHWLRDSLSYMKECEGVGLNAHLERSKSGKGGHVWIFFDRPYSCHKARRIGYELIRRSQPAGTPQWQNSFDRLFPNQDFLPRGGYGNLIALPMQGAAVAKGNTVFINPVNMLPYEDQWIYIASISKHKTDELDAALDKLEGVALSKHHLLTSRRRVLLTITVGYSLTLPRRDLSAVTLAFLREKLNFLNAAYLTKKRLDKPVYDVQKYFQLMEESSENLYVPRGFLPQLTRFLTDSRIPFKVVRQHVNAPVVKFSSRITLTSEQERMVSIVSHTHEGILVAPPGSGKTMMALELAARHSKPTLILVHRRELLDQWAERIHTHLDIPKSQIGILSGRVKKIGLSITVALLQSLARYPHMQELARAVGTVIVDECHHIPANTFRGAIVRLNPDYLYGLTATPKRKWGDEQLIYSHIGPIIATMETTAAGTAQFDVKISKTNLQLPFQWSADQFELLAKVICFDTDRNQRIVRDVLEQLQLKRKVLVLSERKEHLYILAMYLKGQCETVLLTGDDSASVRTAKLRLVQQGDYQLLLATGQLFGEGLDVRTIESLVLAFPFSFEGKLIQYTGRLAHSEQPKALIDYHDEHIAFLDKQFKQRRRYYKKASLLPSPKFTPEVHHSPQ